MTNQQENTSATENKDGCCDKEKKEGSCSTEKEKEGSCSTESSCG